MQWFFVIVVGVVVVTIVANIVVSHVKGIRRPVIRHLGCDLDKAESLGSDVKRWDQVNVLLALEEFRGQCNGEMLPYSNVWSATKLAETVKANPHRAGTEFGRYPSGVDETVDCPTNALYLLRHEGKPFVARLTQPPGLDEYRGYQISTASLEVLAGDHDAAKAALAAVLELAGSHSVYKGKTISLVDPAEEGDFFHIEFTDAPQVDQGRMVLPEDVMQVLERNVVGFLKHAETLKRAGRSARHGVLLHGPPGVGKTLAVHYLIGACPGHTVIVLTGRNLRFIRESLMLAKLLAPSIVVFEDVDLVAQERLKNQHGSVLHELLDALDGVGRKTECIILLTTNRPDILEHALAGRPGRVDQAILFPLPDADCRRRLLTLYGEGLRFDGVDAEVWVEKLDGVSAAFIEEWLRKAALLAAEDGQTTAPLRVTESHLEGSVRELVYFGGDLTQRLLGYRPADAARA